MFNICTMAELKDRLLQFIDYLGISISEFERTAKMSNGAVSKTSNNMRTSTIKSIKESYPLLNMEWLKSGIGKMLIVPPNRNVNNINNGGMATLGDQSPIFKDVKIEIEEELATTMDEPANMPSCKKEVKKLRTLLSKAEREISRLEGKVEEQDKFIKLLLDKK